MSFIPNTTPTPNWLYNGEMKKMNETELKVVLLVTRKTLGWFDPMTTERKIQDYISQSQFEDFTGQSNRAIATAIQVCVEYGWIIARDKEGNLCDTPDKRARRKVWYQLGNVFIKKLSGEESSSESGEHFSESGEENDTNLVKKVHSTKETITKETIQKKESTPAKEASDFFIGKTQEKVIEYLKEKGVPEQIAMSELRKFISYWTELNSTGKKQRWQIEKTFEVNRRLATWFSKVRSFNKLPEVKGIRI